MQMIKTFMNRVYLHRIICIHQPEMDSQNNDFLARTKQDQVEKGILRRVELDSGVQAVDCNPSSFSQSEQIR